MQPKHTACASVNGSPFRNTPMSSAMVGLRYWRKPSSVSGMEFAAVANRMSGMAVTAPPPMSSAVVVQPSALAMSPMKALLVPVAASTMAPAMATGAMTALSTAMASTAG